MQGVARHALRMMVNIYIFALLCMISALHKTFDKTALVIYLVAIATSKSLLVSKLCILYRYPTLYTTTVIVPGTNLTRNVRNVMAMVISIFN